MILPKPMTLHALLICSLTLLISACDTQPVSSEAPLTAEADSKQSEAHRPYQANITAETLTASCAQAMTAAKGELAELEKTAPPYNVANILVPLDQLYIRINNQLGMSYLLNYVHPEETVQKAADACVQNFSELMTDIGLSTPLFERLKQVNVAQENTSTQRFHHQALRDFRRSGVDKDKHTRETLRRLNADIIRVGQQFSTNIRSSVGHITLPNADALKGLPEDYIAQHPVQEDGGITITTNYPDLLPFMRYSKDEQARKDLYREHLRRAYPVNRQVLNELISKRHELALLMGYENYAAYATEVMMTKTPAKAASFIERINTLSSKRAAEDYQQLLAAIQQEDPAATAVHSWQKAYAEERVKQQAFEVDTKEVRQYFQYKNVKEGIFALIENLFGVEIKGWETDTWHPSVESFEIWEDDQVIGRFYLDMHPRELKYKHAAQFDVVAGVAGQQLPVAALVCNFPGENDPTALMEHSQVETFLHEFGHLIHHIFAGQQQWSIFSGVATERDFVEAPSQMLEEWIWDYETLSSFAINRDGEVIPRQLVEKMRKARDFGRGTFIRNQMFYAALALDYYRTEPSKLDLDASLKTLQAEYSPFPYMDDTYFYASFGHLYGYSAAYYTYMWSEVIAADILKQFKQQGMRNRELASHYRQTILAPGGSKDADELVEDFLGRPFNFEAFIENLNRKP